MAAGGCEDARQALGIVGAWQGAGAGLTGGVGIDLSRESSARAGGLTRLSYTQNGRPGWR